MLPDRLGKKSGKSRQDRGIFAGKVGLVRPLGGEMALAYSAFC